MAQRVHPPVAENARRYREQHKMSLGEVARQASLSKATLSTLEAGTGNPTVSTLLALAETFGVDPAMMLVAEPTPLEPYLLRRDDAERPGTDDVPLDSFESMGQVELYDVRYEAGDAFRFDGHADGTAERVLVMEGTLRVGPIDEPTVLEAGDYLCFDASRPHEYTALDAIVRATLVVSFPSSATRNAPVHSATREAKNAG